jgi:putative spermidine/putrescine transport system permease protein
MSDSATIGRFGGRRLRVPVFAISCLTSAFLLLPLLTIFPASVTEESFLSFPPKGFSSRWYEDVVADPVWRDSIWYSVRVALASALLATVMGTCAALGARRLRRASRTFRTFFLAPIVLPVIVYVFGLYQMFDSLRMIGTTPPIVVGQACLAFPVVFMVVFASVSAINPALFRASESLGAGWLTTVWRIELPLLKLSIAGAFVFAFAFAFDELMVALFVGGPEQVTFPVEVFRSTKESVTPAVAAASALVTVGALVIIGLSMVMLRRGLRRQQRMMG